jgi:hypothetical protein
VALLAGAAPAAGNVERDRDEVTHVHPLHVAPLLDHLAGHLVAEHQPRRNRGPAAHHVLVAAADVGGDDLQDDAVRALPIGVARRNARPRLEYELRVVDGLHRHVAGGMATKFVLNPHGLIR